MKPEDKVGFENIVGESLEEWRENRDKMRALGMRNEYVRGWVPEDDPPHSNWKLMENPVEHPSHYTWHPVAECKDIVEHFSYNIGTAMAYLWRHERKNQSEDLEKAIKHIQFEIDRLYLSKQSEVSKSAPRESES